MPIKSDTFYWWKADWRKCNFAGGRIKKQKIGQAFCKPIRQAPHKTFGRRKNAAQHLTQFCPLARSWIWIARRKYG